MIGSAEACGIAIAATIQAVKAWELFILRNLVVISVSCQGGDDASRERGFEATDCERVHYTRIRS